MDGDLAPDAARKKEFNDWVSSKYTKPKDDESSDDEPIAKACKKRPTQPRVKKRKLNDVYPIFKRAAKRKKIQEKEVAAEPPKPVIAAPQNPPPTVPSPPEKTEE